MTRTTRTVILLGLLLLGAGSVVYWSFPREGIQAVTVVEASPGTIEQTISATGFVEAHRKILVTAEPGARIAALYFNEQDSVAKGRVLAKLDDVELSTQLRQTESTLKLAEANLANADAVLEQTKTLHEKGYVARQEVDASQRQVDLYRSQVEEKKATIQLVRAKLERSFIRAPISGVVTRKFVEVGGIVTDASRGGTGAPVGQVSPIGIAEIADIAAFEFHAEVDQTDIGKLKRGQQAVVVLDSFPDRRLAGSIEEITASSIEGVGERVRYRVKVALQKPEVSLRLGMTGTADFILARKEHVLTLSAAVVLQRGEAEYVFVVEEGRAHQKNIQTGLATRETVEVISGLRAGDRVVDQGRGKVQDRQRVEVLHAAR